MTATMSPTTGAPDGVSPTAQAPAIASYRHRQLPSATAYEDETSVIIGDADLYNRVLVRLSTPSSRFVPAEDVLGDLDD